MNSAIKRVVNLIASKLNLGVKSTLEEAIRSTTSKSVYSQIINSCTDFRNLLAATAATLSVSEFEMARFVSRKLNLPYLPRLFPIDISLLPEGISIADCRKAGCIPIFGHGRLSGIACLDPRRARELFASFNCVPVGFSLWITIAKALDESERLYLSRAESSNEQLNCADSKSEEYLALNLVCQELIEHRGMRCLIHEAGSGEVEYAIQLNDMREAKGLIHSRIRTKLFSLLEDLAFRGVTLPNQHFVNKTIHVRKVSLSTKPKFELEIGELNNDKTDLNLISMSDTEKLENLSQDKNDNVIAFPSISNSLREAKQKGDEDIAIGKFSEKLVLLIDDNPTFAKVLERYLSKQGVITRYYSLARDALEFIRNSTNKPSAIVCDVHMPEMNGFEFVRRLRGELSITDIPLVMLTSDDDIETELQLLSDGADAFVAKNSDPRLLCVQVKRLIERTTRRSAA